MRIINQKRSGSRGMFMPKKEVRKRYLRQASSRDQLGQCPVSILLFALALHENCLIYFLPLVVVFFVVVAVPVVAYNGDKPERERERDEGACVSQVSSRI